MSWITAPLGEVTTILSGTTPDSSNPAYWNGSHVWVTPTDLGRLDAVVIETASRLISEEGRASCSLPLIPRGSVVMSSRAPIGHLAIAGCDLHTNQGCKSFVCSSKLDAEFLYFTLKHRMADIQAMGSGATFVEVSKSALEAFEISFPETLDKQHEIANLLKVQLAAVQTAQQGGRAQLRDISLLRSRLLTKIFSELDTIPTKRLGDFAETTSGSTPSRGEKRYWEPAEIPWVKTAEVAFSPVTETEEFVSKAALAECSLPLLPPQTVLVAMYGQGKTRGQSAILEIAATTNQACFAILPNDTWDSEFLFYWLMSSYQDLRNLSANRGGNQANLNGVLLKPLQVPAPSKAVQVQIIQRIKHALAEIDLIKQSCQIAMNETETLPARILAQAFQN